MKQDLILAQIVAALTTDGHLQLDHRRGVASFYSKHLEDINYINYLFKSYFEVEGNVFRDMRQGNERYKLFIPNKKISVYLKEKETPVGNKTKNCYFLPSWIKLGDSEIQRAYLRTIFDCEGSIFKRVEGRWRLTYTMHKQDSLKENGIFFLDEIRELLRRFNIETTPVRISRGNFRVDGSISLHLRFEVKRASLRNYSHFIGFRNKLKVERLKLALQA